MNEATIKRLNQINRAFYRATAASFDETRGQPWPGWEQLLPHLSPPITVLDVGCGNGRFGVFLADRLGADEVHYTGIDSNATLLERARTALSGLDVHLFEHDVVEESPETGTYDLVTLFGMLHHVPGQAQRREFMRTLAERVRPGGHLVFAAWCFFEYERYRARIVPWPDGITVDEHDYLLDWRRDVHALRYCHYVNEDEHANLIGVTGLELVDTFRADGRDNASNRYSLLRRPHPQDEP